MNEVFMASSLTPEEEELLEKLLKCTLIHYNGVKSFRDNAMPVINGLVPRDFAAEIQSLIVRNDNSAPRLYEWATVIKEGKWVPSNLEFAEAIKLATAVRMTTTRMYKLYVDNWDVIHGARFNLPEQTNKLVSAEQSLTAFRTYIENFPPYKNGIGEDSLF